ncbi:hypothetical protein DFH09DRAFT_1096845 [Mycena vulgaris]|nr:hypothetical protein DFH09DRAFT_1096845 [Mycena vulgaris]
MLAPPSSSEFQIRICMMLGQLAIQETTSVAALGVACKRLGPILWHTNLNVRVGAVSALARISEHPDGIAAIVDAGIQTHILDLTKSLNIELQVQSRTILRNLGQYNPRRSLSTVIHAS